MSLTTKVKVAKFSFLNKKSYNKTVIDFNFCRQKDSVNYPTFSGRYILMSIIALKASGRDCTNNNELLHKIGVFQRYAMHLFVFTRERLQAIRWRSKYNGCTQRI